MPSKKPSVQFRVDREVLDVLHECAEAHGRSMNMEIFKAVEQWLRKHGYQVPSQSPGYRTRVPKSRRVA